MFHTPSLLFLDGHFSCSTSLPSFTRPEIARHAHPHTSGEEFVYMADSAHSTLCPLDPSVLEPWAPSLQLAPWNLLLGGSNLQPRCFNLFVQQHGRVTGGRGEGAERAGGGTRARTLSPEKGLLSGQSSVTSLSWNILALSSAVVWRVSCSVVRIGSPARGASVSVQKVCLFLYSVSNIACGPWALEERVQI